MMRKIKYSKSRGGSAPFSSATKTMGQRAADKEKDALSAEELTKKKARQRLLLDAYRGEEYDIEMDRLDRFFGATNKEKLMANRCKSGWPVCVNYKCGLAEKCLSWRDGNYCRKDLNSKLPEPLVWQAPPEYGGPHGCYTKGHMDKMFPEHPGHLEMSYQDALRESKAARDERFSPSAREVAMAAAGAPRVIF